MSCEYSGVFSCGDVLDATPRSTPVLRAATVAGTGGVVVVVATAGTAGVEAAADVRGEERPSATDRRRHRRPTASSPASARRLAFAICRGPPSLCFSCLYAYMEMCALRSASEAPANLPERATRPPRRHRTALSSAHSVASTEALAPHTHAQQEHPPPSPLSPPGHEVGVSPSPDRNRSDHDSRLPHHSHKSLPALVCRSTW